MKYVVEIFSVLLVVMWNLFMCISVLGVSSDIAAAKEYKAAVVAEVENSNFNPNVIDACIQEAAAQGYTLEISTCVYGEDANRQMAQVRLLYDYKIPLLGITEQREMRGIAR